MEGVAAPAPAASSTAPAAEAAPVSAPAATESAPDAGATNSPSPYDWESWEPDSEVPEEFRPGVSRVRSYYEQQMVKHEQDLADMRSFLFGEQPDNPLVPKNAFEKDLQRLRELEEQSSAWTKEKQELTERLSKVPDEQVLREQIRQEVFAEAAKFSEAEGQKLVEAFASDYLNSLPADEAEEKIAAAVDLIDEGVDADVALEAVRLGREAFTDFKDLLQAGSDPVRALSKVKQIDGRNARRPSRAARLTQSSLQVSVLGNRQGGEAEARQSPPGSARESLRRSLNLN